MFTVGMGLFGATLILIIYKGDATSVLVGFGFGGALLAMFMRVGGGIFTKAADVGADLVGKVEAGIPEDDPRNPATIADNVGDNVGDCAGMAADLFESYEVTLVASIILGVPAFQAIFPDRPGLWAAGAIFPLGCRAIGVLASIVGVFAVTAKDTDKSAMTPINRGFLTAGILTVLGTLVFALIYVPSRVIVHGNAAATINNMAAWLASLPSTTLSASRRCHSRLIPGLDGNSVLIDTRLHSCSF
jgi:K(+)-stimulated pyrophosphate-energized sodium pump